MKILQFNVELVPVKVVLINGQDVESGRPKYLLQEDIFKKEVPPDAIWRILCEMRAMREILVQAYLAACIRDGMSEDDLLKLRIRLGL